MSGGRYPHWWAVAVLALVAAIGVAMAVVGRGRLAVAATLIWGLVWIAVARSTGEPESSTTAVAAGIAAGIVGLATTAARIRSRARPGSAGSGR